jgi:hypothetical protein
VQLLDHGVLVLVLAREPLIERLGIAEDVGEEKVEQSPKFVEVVLKRGAGNQESVARVEETNDLGKGGLFVLDSMRLMHY